MADISILLKASTQEWLIRNVIFKKKDIQTNESIFTIGNGYLNIRGSLEENPLNSNRGTFLAGVFDKSEAAVEELVKCPSWIDISVWHENKKFGVSNCKVLEHHQVLDLKKGILHRRSRLKNSDGKILVIETSKLVFLHNIHLGFMKIKVTPENFAGELKIFSGLNGNVYNKGFYPNEKVKHLNLYTIERGHDFKYLEMQTRDKKIHVSLATSFKFLAPDNINLTKNNRVYGEKFTSEITFEAKKKKSYEFEKLAVTYTSLDIPKEEIYKKTIWDLKSYIRSGVETEIENHIKEWDTKWLQADIEIVGDPKAQQGIRYNIYQLIINGNKNAATGIGAKFLSGEGYKGHSFWDTEIFIMPFYVYNFPDIAKNLLMYRYKTLGGALDNAKEMGRKGAKYAWESGSSGLECTPPYAVNFDGSFIPIYTGIEEDHIIADIVFAIYKYYLVTGDEEFIKDYGLEIIFQTARYWASRVKKVGNNYEVHKVIGPDEFHEHVDNNAYTNFIIKWHLELAIKLYKHLNKSQLKTKNKLLKKVDIKESELKKWQDITKKIKFNYSSKTKMIEQFDGYFKKNNIEIGRLDKKGQPLLPVGITYKNIAATQLLKQADVVLLMLLFPQAFSKETKIVNYKYYEKRTMHKSSLSHCTYAMMGLDIGSRLHAYNYFLKTLLADLNNSHKNTADGVHAAAIGGAWQTAVCGFGGIRIKSNRLAFKPWLPRKWKRLKYSIIWRAKKVTVTVEKNNINILVSSSKEGHITVNVYNRSYKVYFNKNKVIEYKTK